MYQTYPEEWVLYYAKNGLLFSDPTLHWGMSHFGTCDWASLAPQDTAVCWNVPRHMGLFMA